MEQKYLFDIFRIEGADRVHLGQEELTLEEAKFKAMHEEVICALVRPEDVENI